MQEYKLSVLNSFGWYYSEMNDADSLLYYYKNASGFALEDNSLAEYQAYTVKGLNEYYLANGMYQNLLQRLKIFCMPEIAKTITICRNSIFSCSTKYWLMRQLPILSYGWKILKRSNHF